MVEVATSSFVLTFNDESRDSSTAYRHHQNQHHWRNVTTNLVKIDSGMVKLDRTENTGYFCFPKQLRSVLDGADHQKLEI